MNELLELELWRIIDQGNHESVGGYFGGGWGSLVYKSSTTRILYLVVAMVVVEQDMRCQSMNPLHELDDGWVVAETVLLLGGLDEAVLRREPKVPSQSSHIGPDRDDASPMSLRLMADGEGDEVGKTTKAELDRSKIVEVGHYCLKMERQAEFQCELEIRRLDDLKEEPPQVSCQEGSDRVSQLNLFKCGPVNAATHT
ncbi:hypothetical protein GOBAR_AA04543 [Gossypium barbadense]|uniref:Uncharacterized protein n=1 Tax=Gossypium barbadense TaxID=3634 RepID=A0A2P5YKH8_GOSBA|nr:hypothetical protein GOBAR_AA04543 [Gossypium barbadense]